MKKLLFVLLSGSMLASCANEAAKEAAAPAFNMDSVKATIDANNAALVSSMKANDSATSRRRDIHCHVRQLQRRRKRPPCARRWPVSAGLGPGPGRVGRGAGARGARGAKNGAPGARGVRNERPRGGRGALISAA